MAHFCCGSLIQRSKIDRSSATKTGSSQQMHNRDVRTFRTSWSPVVPRVVIVATCTRAARMLEAAFACEEEITIFFKGLRAGLAGAGGEVWGKRGAAVYAEPRAKVQLLDIRV